jgi:hypothetical protein
MLRAFDADVRRERGDAARGYTVSAVFSLNGRVGRVPQLSRSRYVRIASAACGLEVARRSWVVVADFPNAAAASVGGSQVSFLARERRGWRIWYGWNPNLDEVGFPSDAARPAPH